MCGSFFPPQAGQCGAGRQAPHWAQMAPTDRQDGGDINTLINNYPNNDTGYTEAGRRRTEGWWEKWTEGETGQDTEEFLRPGERGVRNWMEGKR